MILSNGRLFVLHRFDFRANNYTDIPDAVERERIQRQTDRDRQTENKDRHRHRDRESKEVRER